MEDKNLQKIKSIIHEFWPDAEVLLFGSRVNSEEQSQNDYDILVIVNQELSPKEKLQWSSKVHKAIVNRILIPIDLIIESDREVNRKKKLYGHIIREAMKEGVTL